MPINVSGNVRLKGKTSCSRMDPKTVFDVNAADRSQQEPGESINASTASRVYYVFIRAAIYPLVYVK